jgi:4-amino-4-deoxy-L-arabinose transferase-like glycosyltransferase
MSENQVFGIIVVFLCTFGFFISWKYTKTGMFGIAILLLMLSGLLLRIYIAADFFLHFWDERYHALVAKNLMHHFFTPTLYNNPILPNSDNNWTTEHIWLHKQPLPLWIMAISMKLFGINEIALRIPSIVLSTLGIGITYQIGKHFFNRKVAFVAAFLFSINGLILELTGGRIATDHVDIFYLFFIILSIYLITIYAENNRIVYNILAGMSLGAAILTKWLPALIILPLWILILFDSKSLTLKQMLLQFFFFLFVAVLIFLPWQIYIFHTFPLQASAEAKATFSHLLLVVEKQTGSYFYFIEKIRINYGELIYLPLLWFLWITFKDIKNLKHLAITLWVLIPILFFSFAKTKMQAYILFISPALFLITADFFYMIKENNKLNKWLIRLLLFLLIALPIRYCIERLKPFDKIDRNPAWVTQLLNLKSENIKNGVLFNYKAPIEAMFYTDLTVYPDIPDKNIIVDLLQKNYAVIINDDGKLPEDISSIKGIVKRQFLPVP